MLCNVNVPASLRMFCLRLHLCVLLLDFKCAGFLPCFDRVLLAATANSVVQSNNSIQFPLLQLLGGCYTVSPCNLCLPFILCLSPHLLVSSPSVFLSRGFVTAVKPCIKALTYGVLPLLLPLIPPSMILPFDTLLKCSPPLPPQLNWPTLPLQCSYLQLMLWSW